MKGRLISNSTGKFHVSILLYTPKCRKVLKIKGLGRRGRAPRALSPLHTTTYDDSEKKREVAQEPLDIVPINSIMREQGMLNGKGQTRHSEKSLSRRLDLGVLVECEFDSHLSLNFTT
jgi:hypothetical protein